MSQVDVYFREYMDDPSYVPEAGVSKEDAAWKSAWNKWNKYKNDMALSLAFKSDDAIEKADKLDEDSIFAIATEMAKKEGHSDFSGGSEGRDRRDEIAEAMKRDEGIQIDKDIPVVPAKYTPDSDRVKHDEPTYVDSWDSHKGDRDWTPSEPKTDEYWKRQKEKQKKGLLGRLKKEDDMNVEKGDGEIPDSKADKEKKGFPYDLTDGKYDEKSYKYVRDNKASTSGGDESLKDITDPSRTPKILSKKDVDVEKAVRVFRAIVKKDGDSSDTKKDKNYDHPDDCDCKLCTAVQTFKDIVKKSRTSSLPTVGDSDSLLDYHDKLARSGYQNTGTTASRGGIKTHVYTHPDLEEGSEVHVLSDHKSNKIRQVRLKTHSGSTPHYDSELSSGSVEKSSYDKPHTHEDGTTHSHEAGGFKHHHSKGGAFKPGKVEKPKGDSGLKPAWWTEKESAVQKFVEHVRKE